MIEVKITTNVNKVEEAFVRIGKNLINYAPVLKSSGEYMVSSIQNNFLSQGRPNAWAPLSPMTILLRTKGRGSRSPQILMDTGNLFKSITYAVDESSVKIGTNVKYAKRLQFGGTSTMPACVQKIPAHSRKIKGKNVRVKAFERHQSARTFNTPSRPFVLFQDQDVEALQGIFVRFVDKSIKEGIP